MEVIKLFKSLIFGYGRSIYHDIMKAVVIGGSGATGRELVSQLLEDSRFEEVLVLLRKPFFGKRKGLTEVVVDFEHLEDYKHYIQGDVAFSCLGTTLKAAGSKEAQWRVDHDYQLAFASLAKENGVKSFVLLSAVGAHEDASFFYNKMKGTLERNIRKLGFLQLVIVQPGGIERPNSDRLGEKIFIHLLKFSNALGLFKRYAPIATDRLAKAMLASFFAFREPDKVVSLDEIWRISQ